MQFTTHTNRALQRVRTRHVAALGGLVAATALAVGIVVTPVGPRSETAPAAVAVPPSMPALYEEAGGGAAVTTLGYYSELEFAAVWWQPAPSVVVPPSLPALYEEAGRGTASVVMDPFEFARLWYRPAPGNATSGGTTSVAMDEFELARLWYQPYP